MKTYSVHMGTKFEVLELETGLSEVVAAQMTSISDNADSRDSTAFWDSEILACPFISPTNLCTCSKLELKTWVFLMFLTHQNTSNGVLAWIPLPKVVASDASIRESRSMAAPFPAPVRMTVRTSPSISAAVAPVSSANTVTHA